MSVVASRYSEAIYDLAVEENCLQEMYDSYILVTNVFKENSDLIEILSHPEVVVDEKVDIVKDVFKSINKHLLNFICILIEKDRLREIYTVFEDFEVLYNVHFNIAVANVYSVDLLSEEQISLLKTKLEKKLDRDVKINNTVDKSLIGGMKIMIDNHVMDYSIKTKINDLSEDLHKIQIR